MLKNGLKWIKKHPSKQAVPITYTPWGNVFCSCYFRRFVRRFFSDGVKKLVVYFDLCESFLHF